MEEKLIVTCECRIYSIQIPGADPIKIGLTSPMNMQMPDELFNEFVGEYEEVISFFSRARLLNNNNNLSDLLLTNTKNMEKPHNEIRLVSPEDVRECPDDIIHDENIDIGKNEKTKDDISAMVVTRLNHMVGIKDEFTREDYQELLKNTGFHVSKYVGHDDLSKALALRRIKRVSERRSGNKFFKYIVINRKRVAQQEYMKVLKGQRKRKK